MKYSKKDLHNKKYSLPEILFEQQRLTSFSGLVILQQAFRMLKLTCRLKNCFKHIRIHPIYGFSNTLVLLIVHLTLGYRKIRDLKYYAHDPMVKRITGLTRLPDHSTLSRILGNTDEKSFSNCRKLNREIVLDRICAEQLPRVTCDFDGSVLSTKRHAEGSAVGYNKKKKGARSYYPLNSTISQTGQVFDFLHRSGNVHDSNGAVDFAGECFDRIKERLPSAVLETRMDGAFFSREMTNMLKDRKIEFTLSVPYLRMAELKFITESRQRWRSIDFETDYFEKEWKPDSWHNTFRFIFVRTLNKVQHKEPVQLDMFLPDEYVHSYKVIVTNKRSGANNVIQYHNGRGSQEGIFAELKTQSQMDYIPFKRLLPNKFYTLCAVLAHNINKEIQMTVSPAVQQSNFKRAALWSFEQIDTFRKNLIIRAGMITRPGGRETLTVSGNMCVAEAYSRYIEKLREAA